MCSQNALSFATTVYTMSITQWICQCKCISAMLQCSDEMGGFTFLFGIGRWFVKTSRIEPSEASNRVVRAQALSDLKISSMLLCSSFKLQRASLSSQEAS